MSDTLHQRFSAMTAAGPDRPAVLSPEGSFTYRELNEASDRVATEINKRYVPGRRVALRLGRSPQALVGLLGILKAGCAYVPVDPEYPTERQDYVLADSAVSFVLSAGRPAAGERVVASVDRLVLTERPGGSTNALPDGSAYVIYTSGTTGAPKGCVVSHRNVLSLMDATRPLFSFGSDDVWSQFHSISFDFSVWEIWGAWLYGGTVAMVPQEVTRDPEQFVAFLAKRRVTVLNQVPSVFSQVLNEVNSSRIRLPDLRYVIFGGEAVRRADVLRWWDLGTGPAEMVNMYGITETTVHVTHCPLSRAVLGLLPERTPIGRPLPHLEVSLRAENGELARPGEPGEIWVSGGGVSAGYLDRLELTRERFVTDARDGMSRHYYRSGDWAVRDDVGNLYYAGRRDGQIKLHGFRIELGEVEAALEGLPSVRHAACRLERNQVGADQLVAYVVRAQGQQPQVKALRESLVGKLPAHLVPHRINVLSEFPVTSNGKLDWARLDCGSNGV